MKKNDKDAFLRSIAGAAPIEKKNKLTRPIRENAKTKNIEIKSLNKKQYILEEQPNKKSSKSFFTLEKSQINKKLKRGQISVDKKIDFHGMSLINAEQLFIETIKNCYDKKLRCLLFVTGKGILNKFSDQKHGTRLYYGKIRNGFLDWVKDESLKKYILSVEQAGKVHGADGAFFVYLRKRKINY